MKRRGRMHLTAATAALAVACLSPHLARSAESLPAFGMGLAPTAPEAYAALPGVKRYRSFLPAKVDLSDRFPPPGDQGQQGSCSAWATTYAARSFLMTREAGQAQLPAEAVMSPAFVFNQIRPGPDCLRGAALPAALELLKTKGAVPNAAFPYGDCTLRPTPELAAQAQRFRIADFQAVEHRNEQTGAVNREWRDPVVIDDIKGALVRGRPVVFGMKIPKDFTIPLMGFKGVYRSSERFNRWSPDSSDAMHAMTLVGYDDTKQAFKLINSWSQRWGDGGFMWIDYGTFKNLVGEAYVVEPRSIAPEAKPAVDPRQTRQAQMARVLDQPVCGRLRLSWQGDRPIIEGFARPEDGAAVRERAAALAPNLEWRGRATPFPACEAEVLLTEGLTKEGVQLGISRPSQPPLTASEVTLADDDLFSIEV